MTFPTIPQVIVYPERDGLPLADNTVQLRWIFVLHGNLSALFRERDDVFVASNLLWYPRENHPEISAAPDVMVAFDRPKGDRGSYRQWEEADTPPTVVFEVLSPSNTVAEYANKLEFYDDYGVEEYYIYDPDTNGLFIYFRNNGSLLRMKSAVSFVSTRLNIHFLMDGPEMEVYYPDGRPFLTFEELAAEVQQRAARIAALSRKARQQQLTPEELAELEQLEEEPIG